DYCFLIVASARPHFGDAKWSIAKLRTKLLEQSTQGELQSPGLLRSQAHDDQTGHQRHAATAVERTSNLAHQHYPFIKLAAEINQRSDRFAVAQQRLPIQVRKYFVTDAQSVGPN